MKELNAENTGRTSKSVAVIDTGGANLGSVLHALGRLGVDAHMTRDADRIRAAHRVILPGVGSAAAAMATLAAAGLVEVVRGLTQPVLGICLGLQLLYESSEEGEVECLGLIPGQVCRLQAGADLRLPHMGWNRLEWQNLSDPLASGLAGSEWFYFVHGYAAPPGAAAIAVCSHGTPFAAVVRRRNFVACQFHPEKSAVAGARLLHNFVHGGVD